MLETVFSDRERHDWLSEHETLYEIVVRLTRATQQMTSGRVTERRLLRMGRELDALKVRLRGHFQREEIGLFVAIERAKPQTSSQIDTLKIEHGDAMRQLDWIRDEVQVGGVEAIEEIAEALGRLEDLLYRHEATEEQLGRRSLGWGD